MSIINLKLFDLINIVSIYIHSPLTLLYPAYRQNRIDSPVSKPNIHL